MFCVVSGSRYRQFSIIIVISVVQVVSVWCQFCCNWIISELWWLVLCRRVLKVVLLMIFRQVLLGKLILCVVWFRCLEMCNWVIGQFCFILLCIWVMLLLMVSVIWWCFDVLLLQQEVEIVMVYIDRLKLSRLFRFLLVVELGDLLEVMKLFRLFVGSSVIDLMWQCIMWICVKGVNRFSVNVMLSMLVSRMMVVWFQCMWFLK